jgi:hypothetical protein
MNPNWSVWKSKRNAEFPLSVFSGDFQTIVADIESVYKLEHRKTLFVEIRPYKDFIKWAEMQSPDWDRYSWDGTKVLVEQGLLPKSALTYYDRPDLSRAGITVNQWLEVGFEHYVNTLAKSIREGKNVPPLLTIEGRPIDGRHRALAATRLGLKTVPIADLS